LKNDAKAKEKNQLFVGEISTCKPATQSADM
jgi:hypothetical protein